MTTTEAVDILQKSIGYGGELSAHREEIVAVLEYVGALEAKNEQLRKALTDIERLAFHYLDHGKDCHIRFSAYPPTDCNCGLSEVRRIVKEALKPADGTK